MMIWNGEPVNTRKEWIQLGDPKKSKMTRRKGEEQVNDQSQFTPKVVTQSQHQNRLLVVPLPTKTRQRGLWLVLILVFVSSVLPLSTLFLSILVVQFFR